MFTAVREQEGRLDILFANAGTAEHATIEQITESQFEAGFSTNVKGVFFCMQKALPLMPDGSSRCPECFHVDDQGDTWIRCLEREQSCGAELRADMGNELRARRIRVNVVSPGPSILLPLRRLQVAGKMPSGSCRNWRKTSRWVALEIRTRLQKRSYSSPPRMQATSMALNSSSTAGWFRFRYGSIVYV